MNVGRPAEIKSNEQSTADASRLRLEWDELHLFREYFKSYTHEFDYLQELFAGTGSDGYEHKLCNYGIERETCLWIWK